MLVWLSVTGASLWCAPLQAQTHATVTHPAPEPPASAPPAGDERAQLREAMHLFDAQRYADALPILRSLAVNHGEPLYLFNLGQAYRELGDCAAAVAAYRRFLDAPLLDARAQRQAARRSAQQYLLALGRCAPSAASSAPASEPAPSTIPAPRAMLAAAAPATPRMKATPTADRPALTRPALWASCALFGAGAAGVVAASYWAVKANSLETSLEARYGGDAATRWDARAEQDLHDGQRYATLARWLVSSAALAVTAGTLVLLLGRRRQRRELSVLPGRHGAEVSWNARF